MPVSLIKCSYLLKTESTENSRISLAFFLVKMDICYPELFNNEHDHSQVSGGRYRFSYCTNYFQTSYNYFPQMKPRSHTQQHNQIWAIGTQDTILPLIKGRFYVFGSMALQEMVVRYKKKRQRCCIREPKKHTDDNVEAKFFSVVKGLIWHAFKSNG